MRSNNNARGNSRYYAVVGLILGGFVGVQQTAARPKIRDAFFAVYPNALGTPLDTVPSNIGHCGVCHYDFAGGGPRNPYGVRLGEVIGDFPNNNNGREQAVLSIQNEDADADGFSTLIEVTDTTTFTNTPTFPGLTPLNVGNITAVDVTDIQAHLVPSTGGDTTPPDVTVIAPNGGETLVGNSATTVQWSATDASGVAVIDLYLSDDNGLTFKPIALGRPNTGSHTWYVANRPTALGILRVVATDNAFNTGQDDSDAIFMVRSPPGGIVPTTLRDFDQPGSQPFEAGILNPPEACAVCHGNYDSSVEPYFNWQGSMMAQASRDVLFLANMVIANQDAPDSADLCLRCHLPRGWLQGRSVPTDGSQMLPTDQSGVSCDFCHRLVDPIYDPTENPPEDQSILADLSFPASNFGNGMATIDPTGARRGPFLNAATGHPVLVSPFHREAALCGTCHDVSNPAFEKDGNGNYHPNAFDTPAADFSAHTLAPVERTYSEWFYSEYNTPGGVFAPEFGGNLDFVSTCQDCHMRDVTGEGCNFGTPPTRDDLPLHDITGGSTWLPGLLGALFPGEVDETALQAGIARARYMLQNAADLSVVQEDTQLKVTITNNTGHKLPTGYPEGRRMWINVKFYDAGMTLVSESGAYDSSTGVLGHDAEAKIYDIEPGLDEVTAPLAGVDPGPSFHFVLNNKIFKDNRIPPRGFSNAAYADFGGAPVAHSYADGQYWDDTFYTVPPGATSAEVTVYYQSTSKEFIEFLRDENTTNTKGQEMYDLWNNNDKCPPEIMQTTTIGLAECFVDTDCDDAQYCNGSETCDLGTNTCQPGTPVNCNDGVDCTVDMCNETTDTCDHVPDDGSCDNGLYCDGAETCNALIDCQPGTPVECDDSVACTVDSCNETTDTCDHVPDDGSCDNGLYCDGVETCNALIDCQPGTPVECDDSVNCTVDSCNEATDSCSYIPDHVACDDSLFCTGFDYCDPRVGCVSPGNPCADPADCDEDADSCGCSPSSAPTAELLEEQVNAKNRFLSVAAGDPARKQAIRVRFVSLPWPFDAWNYEDTGQDFFVGAPREMCENSGKGLETAPADCPAALPTDTFWAAPLVCDKEGAYYMDWHGWCDGGTCVGGLKPSATCTVDDDCVEYVHLYHEGIVPSLDEDNPAEYEIQVVDSTCNNLDEANYSAALTMIQSLWGDVCGPGSEGACSGASDGTVDVTNDVLGVLDKFANINNLQKARADLEPGDEFWTTGGSSNGPDFKVNVANDVLYCLAAFGGAPYPFVPGDPCGPG